MTLPYKTSPKGSVSLSTAKLRVGETFTGLVENVRESDTYPGSYSLTMQIDGQRVFVNTSGNLKYEAKDGKIQAGDTITVTKTEDTMIKGYPTSRFNVTKGLTSAPAKRAGSTVNPEIAAKIAEQRARQAGK